MIRRILGALVGLTALLGPLSGQSGALPVPPPQFPPKVTFAGDSITVQSGLAGATYENTLTHADIGWTASNAWPYIQNDFAKGHADVVVWALGTNDSRPPSQGGDGWSMNDVNLFRWVLAAAPSGTCAVVVLPGSGTGMDQEHYNHMVQARIWLKYNLIPEARNAGHEVVMVDWQQWIWADPSILANDGIHIAPDPNGPWGLSAHAGEAREAMIQGGIDAC